MPKQINHNERRQELAESVWDVILREGISNVSVRSVATTSGWSVGSVRYYFPKQEALLTFALNTVIERIDSRMNSVIASLRPGKNELETSIRIVEEGLPLDHERLAEFHVLVAFIDRARFDQETRDLINEYGDRTRHLCRYTVGLLLDLDIPERGHPFPDPDIEGEAARLHVLWNGLAAQIILSPQYMAAETARALLREHLEDLQQPGKEPSGMLSSSRDDMHTPHGNVWSR